MKLRAKEEVMDIKRLGSMHQSRLSFARSMLRQMAKEHYKIARTLFDLDENGYGRAVYEVKTKNDVYNLVVFSNHLDDDMRTDRVIASKWDVSFSLIKGELSKDFLKLLEANVPLQEAGRNFNKGIVLGRANKSVRLFNYILERLSQGLQPDVMEIAKVGYILRTTAVYGSGKFGISDFERLRKSEDFNQSFWAEMCAVYLMREYSIDLINHIAKARGGEEAVLLAKDLQRFLGVGNATGLGMAPYLIKHAKVVDNWLYQREKALNIVKAIKINDIKLQELLKLLRKATKHLSQIVTIDEKQDSLNQKAKEELERLSKELASFNHHNIYNDLLIISQAYSLETQEIVISCILELFPEEVDAYSLKMNADESLKELKDISLKELKAMLEQNYDFAINTDFDQDFNKYYFWYVSEEKEEPRLGIRGLDIGEEKEQPLDIARQASKLYESLKHEDENSTIASYLLKNPKYSQIARRVYNMSLCHMGEIRANILSKDFLPIHLLRAKLAMFGATKFDPRSDRWVQVTFFQGAPLLEELSSREWLFPLIPKDKNSFLKVDEDFLLLSKNELKAACMKAFIGLGLKAGEADLISLFVIDLQKIGLNGVKYYTTALNYLKNSELQKIEIEEKGKQLIVDLKNSSILFYIQLLTTRLLELIPYKNHIELVINNCHNRYFIYSQLVRLADIGYHAKASFGNVEFIIRAKANFPDLYGFDASDDKRLVLKVAKTQAFKPKAGYLLLKASKDFEACFNTNKKLGIKVEKKAWNKLLECTKGILVPSDERSRQNAGA